MKNWLQTHLQKTNIFIEAANAQPGKKLWQEILIFLAVFLVANMAMSPFITIGMVIIMIVSIINPAMSSFIGINMDMENADVSSIMAAMDLVNSSEAIMILALFCDAAMILAVVLFTKALQKRKISNLGFVKQGMIKEYAVGMVVGFGLFTFAVLICLVTGAGTITGFSANIPVMIIVLFFVGYLIQGMAEEVLCRGYFMVSVGRRYSVAAAILANSLAFAALHLFNSGITLLAFINLTLFGVFASIYFIKRGNIWGVGAMHSIWNFVQGNFYGIQVSGMSHTSSILTTNMNESASLINGGSFGLEGGLAVTICYLVGIVIVLMLPEKKQEG